MADYDSFAKIYDSVMGVSRDKITLVKKIIKENNEEAESVLELACGTGEFLLPLSKQYQVAGLDISEGMLDVARKKVKKANLFHGDMRDFNLGFKSDVVLCLFDSINHLLEFSEWKSVFRNAYNHLNDNGLFVFDVNTVDKFKNLVKQKPVSERIDNGFMTLNVEWLNSVRDAVNWNIKVYESHYPEPRFLYEENIAEKAFPKDKIMEALLPSYFQSVQLINRLYNPPGKEAQRLFFICNK